MSIRDIIMKLIDAPDKDKEFVVECNIDELRKYPESYTGWVTCEVKQVTNCTWGTVTEIRFPEDPE